MEDQITVREMLEYMESGLSFSISFITYDHQRRKGGKIIQIHEAKLLQAEQEDDGATRPRTRHEETLHQLEQVKAGRDPRHQKWYTRNIRILQEGNPTSLIKKIHPPLVTIFNAKIVVA